MKEALINFSPAGKGVGTSLESPQERKRLIKGDLVRIDDHFVDDALTSLRREHCPSRLGRVNLVFGKGSQGSARCTDCAYVQSRVYLGDLIRKR